MFSGVGGGNRVHVQVTGENKDLKGELRESNQDIDKFGKRTEESFKQTGRNISVGLAVVAAAGFKMAETAIDRAEDMASAYAVTEQVIEQTGGAANVTAEQIAELSKEQAFNTGINKLAVTEANNVLLTFKNLRNEVGEGNDIFDQTSRIMLDMATVMGTDAKSGAIQLGKALNDPITGLTALARVGVTFTDQQKAQIRNFQESGDLMSAQKIILAELESQMGGTAEAAADDSAKIARSFDEIAESIGMKLLPLLKTAAIEIQSVLGELTKLERLELITGQQIGTVEFAAGAINDLTHEVGSFNGSIRHMAGQTGSFAEELELIFDASELDSEGIQRLIDNLDLLTDQEHVSEREARILAETLDQKLREAVAGAADEVQRSKKPYDDLADSAGDLADETGDAAAATDSLREAQLKAASPAFALFEAQNDVNDAVADYNEAADKYGDNSREAAEASWELVTAQAELDAAAAAFAEGGGQAAIDSLQTMLENAEVAPETIDLIIAALGRYNQFVVNPKTFTTRRGDGFDDFAESRRSQIEFGLPRAASHAGGRVNAPRGQEVLVPMLGGEEVSNPDLGQNGGGNGSQVVVYQTFERVEGDRLDEDIAFGLLTAGVRDYIEQVPSL